MEILEFLSNKTELSDEIRMLFQAEIKMESYKKGQHITTPGNYNRNIFFLESGLARIYYTKDEKTITHIFIDQNQMFCNIEVIYYNEISHYGIECIEDCVVSTMNYERVFELAKSYPIIDEITRNILIESLHRLSNRLRSMQLQTAEERYNQLLTNYPEILQRAPLGHIASFLGISQPTLSVIRGKK